MNQKQTIPLIIILIMIISIVSATSLTGKAVTITGKAISGFSSFVDFVKSKISGRSTSGNFNLNISVPNSPPQIVYVGTISDQSITEGGEKGVEVNFIVYDQDGYETITEANASYINSTGFQRYNPTCQKTNNVGAKQQNFTCIVGIWYYDNSGIWTITINAKDHLNTSATNTTTNFTILQTLGMVTSPETLTWATLTSGDKNKTAIQNIQINNTANTQVFSGNISINASNIVGDTYSSYALYAGNFSVGIINQTNTSSCTDASSTKLERFIYKPITGANLSVGNISVGDGRAQTKIYVCLREIGQEIIEQNYTTTGEGPWIIKIQ
jgi:hypothetical protein